jgi:hypothetical protein
VKINLAKQFDEAFAELIECIEARFDIMVTVFQHVSIIIILLLNSLFYSNFLHVLFRKKRIE